MLVNDFKPLFPETFTQRVFFENSATRKSSRWRFPKCHIDPLSDYETKGIRNHFPECARKRARCKMRGCGMKSSIKCSNCKITLCLNKVRNCFADFHKWK